MIFYKKQYLIFCKFWSSEIQPCDHSPFLQCLLGCKLLSPLFNGSYSVYSNISGYFYFYKDWKFFFFENKSRATRNKWPNRKGSRHLNNKILKNEKKKQRLNGILKKYFNNLGKCPNQNKKFWLLPCYMVKCKFFKC